MVAPAGMHPPTCSRRVGLACSWHTAARTQRHVSRFRRCRPAAASAALDIGQTLHLFSPSKVRRRPRLTWLALLHFLCRIYRRATRLAVNLCNEGVHSRRENTPSVGAVSSSARAVALPLCTRRATLVICTALSADACVAAAEAPSPVSPQVNLFLRVVRRREDGYHDLASLFHVIDLGDQMRFTLLPDAVEKDELSCDMEGVPTDDSNLVIKASVSTWRLR